jgi:hypothetical protein
MISGGAEPEWLGSIAWDGHPGSVFCEEGTSVTRTLARAQNADEWKHEVLAYLSTREDATLPEMGWPWPWENSQTTDYAYAFDEHKIWVAEFGRGWVELATCLRARLVSDDDEEAEPLFGGPKNVLFPDMSNRSKVTFGKRSGVIVMR